MIRQGWVGRSVTFFVQDVDTLAPPPILARVPIHPGAFN